MDAAAIAVVVVATADNAGKLSSTGNAGAQPAFRYSGHHPEKLSDIAIDMAERKILNGWKEIAAHVGRSTRTVQRWEFTLGMPVYRPSQKARSSVTAFADEIEAWISRTDIDRQPYVRPILVMLDKPDPQRLTNRKLALEIEKFNVLTAYSLEELFGTAEHAKYDAIVMSCGDFNDAPSVCTIIKDQFPGKPLIVISGEAEPPEAADHVVRSTDDRDLLEVVLKVFGKPKL